MQKKREAGCAVVDTVATILQSRFHICQSFSKEIRKAQTGIVNYKLLLLEGLGKMSVCYDEKLIEVILCNHKLEN